VTQSFLLCRLCGVLHPVPTPIDADAETVEELAEFRAAHEVHVLEDAQRLPDSPLFDGLTWDPMSTRWLRVAAGADVLLVRSWRTSIDEPRHHEVTTAPPPAADCIEVDEPLLRRAVDRYFYPQTVRPAKLEHFVHSVRELIADLEPDEVETSFDDATLPNTRIGPFPAQLCDTLIDRCAPIFDDGKMERMRAFVADQCLEDGALALHVRRIVSRSA
jgi:hypothetical protein